MVEKFRGIISPSSLRYQLLSRILLILSFILLLIGSLQYFVMKDFLYQNEADTMQANLMSLSSTIIIKSEFPREDQRAIPQPDPSRFLLMENFSLGVIGSNGEFTDILAGKGLPAPELSRKEFSQLVSEFFRHRKNDYKVLVDSDGNKQLVIYRPFGKMPGASINAPEGFLQLGTSLKPLQDTLMRQLLTFIVLASIALAAGIAVYFSVIRRTLTPLSNIVASVEKINAGNLSDRIPDQQGQEEIERLTHSFNKMLQRLETSFEYEIETKEQMRRFIADASHELRTPLTSIHGFLEVLLRGAANRPEQLYSALNSMHGESKRIIKLVEDLLLLAKLDRTPELQLSEVNLSDLVGEMEPQLRMLAETRTVRFNLEMGILGRYDSDKIKQIILNLFQNAVQHTDASEGKILVTLARLEHEVVLSVQDNGPGIPPEILPHVFDRFYRIDSSRTRQSGGAGLGLAITKSIAEAHGGRAAVESVVGQGTIFTIHLPLL